MTNPSSEEEGRGRDDLAERGLRLLRESETLAPPDRVLERRLRARHRARRRGLRRILLPGLLVLSLSGAASAGGWEWVRRWWYAIEVDGRRTAGVVDGAGTRTFRLPTANGGDATVRVRRGAEGTRIDVSRRDARGEDHDFVQEPRAPLPELPASALGHPPAPAVHRGDGFTVHLLAGGSAPRLVLRRAQNALHGAEAATLTLLATLPQDALAGGAAPAFRETPDGVLEMTLRGPDGAELVLDWRVADDPGREPHETELRTGDGRVRVRVGPRPRTEAREEPR